MYIEDIMKIGKLKSSYLCAGQGGIKNKVDSITIMDIKDIASWLRGGELILSGVLFEQCFSIEFIDSLVKKNIPGIVTKKKFLGGASKETLAYCDKINFPIIIAPEDCNWSEIIIPLIKSVVEEPYKIIQQSQEFHTFLMQYMIAGANLSQFCKQIKLNTNMSIAVTDADLHLIGYSDDFKWKELTRTLSSTTTTYSGDYYYDTNGKKVFLKSFSTISLSTMMLKIVVYDVVINDILYGHILLLKHKNEAEISTLEYMRINQMGLILAMNTAKQAEFVNYTRRFNNMLFEHLLHETTITVNETEALLSSLGKKLHKNYKVIYLFYEKDYNVESFIKYNKRVNNLYNILERNLPYYKHVLMFDMINSHIILIPDTAPNFDKVLSTIKSYMLNFLELTSSKVYIGVSDIVPVNQISKGYNQAKIAANYIMKCHINTFYMTYNDLGIIKFLMDNQGNIDKNLIKNMYTKYIYPLKKHDKKYNTDLLRTLELFIKNDFCNTKTEKDLFIHKNTLRARLNSINKILNCDLKNSEDIFNIQLALKLRFIE